MSEQATTLDYGKAKPISADAARPWVAVDLDGSLAKYTGWKGKLHIGEPIPAMVDRLKRMLADGEDVKIFTARVANDPDGTARKAIQDWTQKHLGHRLPITNVKDEHMRAIYDDRAIQLERNTGRILGSQRKAKEETEEAQADQAPGQRLKTLREKEDRTPAEETEFQNLITEQLKDGTYGKNESPFKFKYGSTQADIPPDSEAGRALDRARARINVDHLAGDGLVRDGHVTIRYGLKGGDEVGIRAHLEKQHPFEATLGKVSAFPPSEHSDGAAPIVVVVDSTDLRRIEKELDRHGNFVPRSFADYRPHATLAYVKPEVAKRYAGMLGTAGKKFVVNSISISHRDGSVHKVELKGEKRPGFYKPKAK
jgi:hypothetical protein